MMERQGWGFTGVRKVRRKSWVFFQRRILLIFIAHKRLRIQELMLRALIVRNCLCSFARTIWICCSCSLYQKAVVLFLILVGRISNHSLQAGLRLWMVGLFWLLMVRLLRRGLNPILGRNTIGFSDCHKFPGFGNQGF